MGRAVVVCLLPVVAFGQVRLSPRREPVAERAFQPRPGEQALSCEVHDVPARMGLSFEFNAGYAASVPLKNYVGQEPTFGELIRVTPEGGKPVYLAVGARSPKVPHAKAALDFGGGFLVGEGRYQVDLAIFDPEGRACRKSWSIRARPKGDERAMKRSLGPGQVAAVGAIPRPAPPEGPELPHLTVLLHAAPFGRGVALRPFERFTLLVALSSLLDQTPAREIRVVVFNLDQQQELYREDRFELAAIDQVREAMARLHLAAVDYGTLLDRRGHTRLLADLIERETKAAPPGGAVVFLGPPSRYFEKLPESAVEGGAARWFDFQFRPLWRRRQAVELPDTIEYAVSRLGGKTVRIHSAGEYAKAIAQLRETTGRAPRSIRP